MHFRAINTTRYSKIGTLRFDAALAILGPLLVGGQVMWVMLAPELFFGQLPMMLLAPFILLTAIVMTGIGWMGILSRPPIGLLSGLIVFAYCMTDFSIRKGGVDPGSFDIQSISKGIVWCVILLFGVFNGLPFVFRDRGLILFFLYALFAICSAFYSPSIGLGLGSGVALLALSCFAGVMSQWSFDRISNTWRNLFFALSLMACLSVIFYFALPEWARDYKAAGAGRLRGLTGSGNSLGPLVALAVIIGLYCWRTAANGKAKTIITFAIVINLLALGLTQSRSATIALIGSIVVTWCLGARAWIWFFISIVAVIGGWISQQQSILNDLLAMVAGVVSRGGDVAEITSVTGRSTIWAASFAIWLRSPWIGFGLGSPRVLISEENISRWQTYESAHNWLLESLISFGVVGTALLLTLLILTFHKILIVHLNSIRVEIGVRTRENWLSICLARCLIFALINGFTEKAFAGMPSPTTVLLAMLAATAAGLHLPEPLSSEREKS